MACCAACTKSGLTWNTSGQLTYGGATRIKDAFTGSAGAKLIIATAVMAAIAARPSILNVIYVNLGWELGVKIAQECGAAIEAADTTTANARFQTLCDAYAFDNCVTPCLREPDNALTNC